MNRLFIFIALILFVPTASYAVLIDDFNRSDRALTVDGWSQTEGVCVIESNTMGGTTAAAENLVATPDTYNADMSAFITITTKCADGEGLSLFVRWNDTTKTGYDIQMTTVAGTDNDRFRLFPFVNGSFGSQLGLTYTVEVSAGDKFGIIVIGTSIICYYAPVGATVWTEIINETDATIGPGGNIAFGAYSDSGRYDDLWGGNTLTPPALAAATGTPTTMNTTGTVSSFNATGTVTTFNQ